MPAYCSGSLFINMSSPEHETERTRVNAWVDAGVLPLVDALNQHPMIVTLDSCENDGDNRAYVYFKFQGSADETPRLVQELAQMLGGVALAGCDYLFAVEYQSSAEPMGKVTVDKDHVGALAAALRGGLSEAEDA